MGWTYKEKPHDVKSYLDSCYTWVQDERSTGGEYKQYQVLKSAIVSFREYYAAIAVKDENGKIQRVFAGVCMLNYTRSKYDPYNFGYKDMTESYGPCIHNCPKSILQLLTPVPQGVNYAQDWRDECWANINNRRAVKKGSTVTFPNPIKFTDGTEHTTFTVVKPRPRKVLYQADNGRYYRLTRRLLTQAQVA